MSPFQCDSCLLKLLLQLGSLYILSLTIQAVPTTDFTTPPDHLTILHTNDFHSKFQQLNQFASLCQQKDIDADLCFGGIARIGAKVKEIRTNDTNVLLLDAGDQYQGSFWFKRFKGYASSYFMNELQYDAMCLGNHEFDEGVSGLAPLLENVTFPVVCANINVSGINEMRKLVKRAKLNVSGHMVGIVGYITVDTAILSLPGPVVFLDEVESVRREVNELLKENVNCIIALGHAGIDVDMKIAREVDGVDIVIGGHTNTFLYNGDPPSIEKPEGSYPKVITRKNGEKALVVQDYAYGKYLGYLKVEFDSKGQVKSWKGNPILLDKSVKQDPDILLKMQPFMDEVKKALTHIVGQTSVLLVGSKECRLNECNLGNLVADAMVFWNTQYFEKDSWNKMAVSLINGGSIRAIIEPGNISLVQVSEALPFSNYIDIIEASGKLIKEILEHSVKDYNTTIRHGKFLQMSGLKVAYDLCQPNGERVVSVDVRCSKCLIPIYEKLDLNKIYKVGIPDFLINGGDGYSMIKSSMKARLITGMDQTKIITYYLKHNSPVVNGIEGRINMTCKNAKVNSGSTTVRTLNIQTWMMLIISIALTTLLESLN